MTAQNGALVFLPGTPATARADNVGIGKQIDALSDHYPTVGDRLDDNDVNPLLWSST